MSFFALQFGIPGLFIFLDSIVYWLLSKLFSLFSALAGAEIIKTEFLEKILDKIYVVIGIFMLFVIAYSLLKSLIEPDNLVKNSGKIVMNIVISMLLLGIVPSIFNYARDIQNIIIEENVIGNIIFVDENKSEENDTITLSILTQFLEIPDDVIGHSTAKVFKFSPGHSYTLINPKNGVVASWEELKEQINAGEDENFLSISYWAEAIQQGKGVDLNDNPYDVKYKPLVSTLTGLFLCYVVLSFCLDLGIRVVKLAFYQMIAPIPIMLRIIPEKKSVFDNWVKGTLATYLEVFIRIFIMTLIVWIVSAIFHGDALALDSGVGFVGKIIIILGLFAFAKQAPKLISDITGIDSGNIKLGIGGKLDSAGPLGKAFNYIGKSTFGAVAGGLGGMYGARVNGASRTSGFLYGALNGWKGKKGQFNKQRQGVYSDVLEQKGTAGWFGGRGIIDRTKEKGKDALKKSYLESEQSKVAEVENSKAFKNKFDELYNKKAQENNKIYQDAYKEFMDKQSQFEANKLAKIKELQEKYQKEKEAFDTDKFKKLQTLQLQLNKANNEHDITKMAQLQRQIAETQSSAYSNAGLTVQINQKSAEQFHDDNLETIMRNAMTIDEAAIRKEAQIAYKKIDSKYKASSTYVANKAAEKAAKEWRENHAEEAAIQESIYENAFKNASKGGSVAGFGGATGGGSSSSSSSSSGSSSSKPQ